MLTLVGSTTYEVIRSLLAPTLPQDKTYDEIVEVLKAHYAPKPMVIAERFHFHRRNQQNGETISDYIAELRKLALHCEFGDYLDQALRDRLVCGLLSDSIQKRLLAEADLTLTRALSLSQGMEAASKNTQSLKAKEGAIAQIRKQYGKGPPTGNDNVTSGRQACYRCGRSNHSPAECLHHDSECYSCGRKGHIAPVCRNKPPKSHSSSLRRNLGNKHPKSMSHSTKWVEETQNVAGSSEELPIFALSDTSSPLYAEVLLNGIPIRMEVDTGAAVSLIPITKFRSSFNDLPLKTSEVTLRTYTGELMDVKGEIDLDVQYDDQKKSLPLIVIAGNGPILLGRNWLQHIRLDWKKLGASAVHHSSHADSLDSIRKRYECSVFGEGLGCIKPFKAKIQVKLDIQPKFFKPRPVPFAIKDTIGEELNRLEVDGIIERINHSEWGAPIVAVPKKDGKFRICGDYKVTVNPVLQVDQYPLPKPEDLFATLAGGKKFTTLDLSQAYLQLELDEQSSQYTTINTHKGLYRYKRLPFGIASAPALFQKTMDTILQNIPKAMCYIDDIMITGSDDTEHLATLNQVLERLETHNIKVNLKKCHFLAKSVKYLGHLIDAEGKHALTDKLDAVKNAPVPRNVPELRSFLGLLNYYRMFLPNIATLLHPLNELLQLKHRWKWTSECQSAFQRAKDLLTSSSVLAHYDPNLPIRLAADASAYGIGAVLSHVLPTGEEKPVAFVSRSLSASEKNYAQIEKEALALVFGVRRFHQYLYGRRFTLLTDHRPLTTILGPKKGIPPIAAARLQRWAVQLAAYTYDIQFKSTHDHGNADALSRLPLQITGSGRSTEPRDFNVCQILSVPLAYSDVQRASRRDPVISRVLRYTQKGWPAKFSIALKPFSHHRNELSIEDDCLLWGTRVIIPLKLREAVLKELHQGHPGVTRMKAIARSHFWWPGLDKEIEKTARICVSCQAVKQAPAAAPLHPWVWPSRPWQRIHVDFAGPFFNKMFFLVIDAHSKWGEVVQMAQTTATKTIEVLRQLFSSYGLPEQIVSDNGPQFVSEEFRQFMQSNGIRHIRCAPYHPASNGLAERFVRTFKEAMKAGKRDVLSLSYRLANFLFTYRSTPHATTQQPPCSLFLGRTIRTRLDLLRPSLQDQVMAKQASQKDKHDQHAHSRSLEAGQPVMVKNMRPGDNWIPGVIMKQLGPVSFLVDVGEGRAWKRHLDHLKI